jgi:hypothetical protein
MQMILSGKLSKLIDMILRGHELASGVSYPSKQIFAEYHTPQNKLLWGIKPLLNFRGVSYPTIQISAGYHCLGCDVQQRVDRGSMQWF